MIEKIPTLTRELARQLDERATAEFGIPSIVLMENAGRGTADVLSRLGIPGKVLICCGRGNNGGDGYVLARHLDLRGYPVTVALWAKPTDLSGDAAINFGILEKSDIPIRDFATNPDFCEFEELVASSSWVVDALLGTGSRGEPRPPLDRVIQILNQVATPKLALDLPSGLDCDTGEPAKFTIRANHTCTFAAMKRGFLNKKAEAFTGKIHVVDIGTPRKLLEEILAAASD